MRVKGRKAATPTWVDKLLNFRHSLTEEYGQAEGEEKYKQYWKRLNRVRKDREAWNAEGHRIIAELEGEKEQPIFRSKDFRSPSQARRAAEIFSSDHPGSRIVRRDSKGRFSKRGRTFQVIGGKK